MNTDYLKWDAESIQELLRRKLTESGVLTDQLYPGSDTSIIIDLFAWTYDVLTYILNNAASDTLFSDSHLYENVNRLVKLLSYNPLGYRTSQCEFRISPNDEQITTSSTLPETINIPKFAHVNSGLTDRDGNDICFSFKNSFTLNSYSYTNDDGEIVARVVTPRVWPTLYNGKFKKYNEEFTSNEIPYESFELTNLTSTTTNIYVDHNSFIVYVEIIDESTGNKKYEEWTQVENLVLNSGSSDTHYELRLNENKVYTLKFGDNIHGKVLPAGAKVHIIYLQSNGEDGVVDPSTIDTSSLTLSIDGFSDSFTMFNMCFGGMDSFKQKKGKLFMNNSLFSETCEKLTFMNIEKSSTPVAAESIDSIKQNAPSAFRVGQRLVIADDFKTYIKQNYGSIVHDVTVFNNNEYISTFYKWLAKYDKLNIDIRKYYYRYADTCDFNNVYIWMKSTSDSQISDANLNSIIVDCSRIKCATAELIPYQAIITKFIPFINHSNSEYEYVQGRDNIDDFIPRIKIRITKNQTAMITNEQLQEKVNNIIVSYFDKENQTFGNIINLNDLVNEILNLGYIRNIRTVHIPEEDKNNVEYVNGLSFAAFTPGIVSSKDFMTFTTNYVLEEFQFPELYATDILGMIEIVDNTYNITNTEF